MHQTGSIGLCQCGSLPACRQSNLGRFKVANTVQALAEYSLVMGLPAEAVAHLVEAIKLCEGRFHPGHPLNIATRLQYARAKARSP
jgi:hypothetical protein